jgi:hypothetical protein
MPHVEPRRALPRVIPWATSAVLLAACSSSGQQVVFTLDTGFQSAFPAHTQEISDVGLSAGWLHNQPPNDLRLLNVYAYSYKDIGGTGLISLAGDLQAECPREFKPHALNSVIFPANSDPPWLVVLAFTISRPGTYRLNQVRINYETNGHTGWQYQNINTKITVRNPPLPGLRPLPASAVC